MRRIRTYYVILTTAAGILLAGLGWALGNFYLVAAGAVVIAAGVAAMNIPMPTIL